jgi:hypothetical protein
MRVVIVSARVGSGHDGAARELARGFRARGLRVDCVDFLDLLPGRVGPLLCDVYRRQLTAAPWSWDWLLAASSTSPLSPSSTWVVCATAFAPAEFDRIGTTVQRAPFGVDLDTFTVDLDTFTPARRDPRLRRELAGRGRGGVAGALRAAVAGEAPAAQRRHRRGPARVRRGGGRARYQLQHGRAGGAGWARTHDLTDYESPGDDDLE